MANAESGYFKILGQDNFREYMNVFKLFTSNEFKDSNLNIRIKFIDLLFTLNYIEKGAICSLIP